MSPLTSHTNRPLVQKSKLLAPLVLWLVVVAPLAAAPPEACQDALTLPLDHSIAGYVPAHGQTHYTVDIERPGFLIIEAHGSGPASPAVRFLGRDCTTTGSNLPVPTIHGRHIHRVRGAGTYFVEVAASDLGLGYRLDAWWIDDDPDHRLPTKEEMDEVDEVDGCLPTKEEMDEVDELAGCLPTKEEMDEVDELAGTGSSWQKIAGHGLLEIARGRGGLDTRFHFLCPWSRRPDLLATFTCAPRLRLAAGDTVTVTPPAADGIRLIGLNIAPAGYLAAEAVNDPMATVIIFDAAGRLAGELRSDRAWLEAGDYFLEVASETSQIRVYAELD